MREMIDRGELGSIYAADLTFHNAYGPDKPWFYQPHLAGGGCVIDLGVHLADLALWLLGFPRFDEVHSRLYAGGRRLRDPEEHTVEDCAFADWSFENGALARLACSWHLPAGRDAVIEAAFYGTEGGIVLRNVGGSFWDLTVEQLNGTSRRTIAEPPDPWGGRAIVHWSQRLARSRGFDPEAERFIELATLLDAIYGR
jgi:predicted dehydrogenase